MRTLSQPQNTQRALFAGFELDLRSSELRKDERCVRLQGQPFQVLCCLLEQAGEVVLREELRTLLWPGETFVDFDHGLNKAISKLREALDDGTGTSLIQTLPRRGYRLVAEVQWVALPEIRELHLGGEPATGSVVAPVSSAEPGRDEPDGAVSSTAIPIVTPRPSIRRARVPRLLWSGAAMVALGGLLWGGCSRLTEMRIQSCALSPFCLWRISPPIRSRSTSRPA